jgi:D-alanyl-D-alanine carboxypeptidase
MNQPLRTSSALSLIVLSSMIVGCARPQAHVAAASQVDTKASSDVGLGLRAVAALNANDVPAAIGFAERAVAKTPGDAQVRSLLGNAYFAGGRFHSAEAAFSDSLTIDPNQQQVLLKFALVEIALGKNDQAAAFLNAHRETLDASDYGLALALAGHTSQAIAVLDPAARQPGADATVRQNLALAHALAGEWNEAKIIASQDVPPAQLDGRIQQWMKLATPMHAADQVAALVGVTPATVDAGQPVQLALGAAPTAPTAQPVKVAAAAPAAQALKVFVKPVTPAPAPAKPAVVAAAAPKAPAAPVVRAVAPAPPPASVSLATLAATAVSEAKAVLSSVLPSAPAPVAKPAAAPRRAAPRPLGKSPAVVQLGAYGSPQRVLTAWNGTAHKYAALKSYRPMSAKFASPKGTFYRLSVQGFNSIGEANSLCNSLRHQGGSCFVRNVAGDTQLASR